MVRICNVEVGPTGYGLMSFNIPPHLPATEDAVRVMKHAFESGARFWNSAEVYGTPDYNSLHILHAYFTRYPEDAAHVVLMVKVGLEPSTRSLACNEAGILRSYENCTRILGDTKKIDIMACARVDPEIPVEESVRVLHTLSIEGKIGGVGLSECSATTVRRASKVAKILAIEVEFSMFTPDILHNGVAEAAQEVGAVVVAYSPLGRGILTGSVTGVDSLGEHDVRRMHPRFAQEALEQNLRIVRAVDSIAAKAGATKAQVALAWIQARSGIQNMPLILPIPGTKSAQRLDENLRDLLLSDDEVKELDEIVARFPTVGERYPGVWAKPQWG